MTVDVTRIDRGKVGNIVEDQTVQPDQIELVRLHQDCVEMVHMIPTYLPTWGGGWSELFEAATGDRSERRL